MRVAALAAAAVLVAACSTAEVPGADATGPPATFAPITTSPVELDAVTTEVPTTVTSTIATIAEPAAGVPSPGGAQGLLDQLRIAPESSPTRYQRDLFEHWTDDDRDGCNTRCEVLAAERRTDLPGLASGWRSIYDGYLTDDPTELEIDHVVALAEAWRSGAHAWDDATRRAFANDLDEPGALVAVTSAANQSKADKDPASWRPPDRAAWCEWALGWLRTKVKWGLTADEAEAGALTDVLAAC